MPSPPADEHSTTNPLPPPPSIKGIDHLKLPVHSLTKTRDFYTTILPFTLIPAYDHRTPPAAFSPDPHPQTHEPPSRAPLRPRPSQRPTRLGPHHLGKHSRVLMGLKSWVMACEDPDGRIVRLYVQDEEHKWTSKPDRDERWLGTVVADPGE
ncbi:uncharacterized protein AB675_259 [Cyphellophora attinorum]|uniref:Glyoxalase/fosfomycin resistance/dioxygenase domain-containing protein n=1 Tax=Cyphellophora attinorum TaxID=1664694 RepID=A0A0N1P1W1_9EURO|nr:uncharacterized protein AB675_259 [Phialophora attinorum]KPI45854.1 hypothetical protein AB675_259 [Phialophora attinorum]